MCTDERGSTVHRHVADFMNNSYVLCLELLFSPIIKVLIHVVHVVHWIHIVHTIHIVHLIHVVHMIHLDIRSTLDTRGTLDTLGYT